MTRSRLRPLALLLAALLTVAACSSTGTTPEGPPRPPLTYVAVGASETVGTGADDPRTEAWPRVLADRLGEGGRQVSFTSLGFGGARVIDVLPSSAMTRAEQLQPGLVTVWLNVNDLISQVRGIGTTSEYEQRLGELVRRLRRGGAATVLVANTPALDRLPAYLDCRDPNGTRCPLPPALRSFVPGPEGLNALVDEYNQVIARVVEREGAVLVDLHAASLDARREGRDAPLVSADGFHPSTAGHEAVAGTFAEVARKVGV